MAEQLGSSVPFVATGLAGPSARRKQTTENRPDDSVGEAVVVIVVVVVAAVVSTKIKYPVSLSSTASVPVSPYLSRSNEGLQGLLADEFARTPTLGCTQTTPR